MQPQLILVDSQDAVVGHAPKDRCHDGDGLLHRAFSVYIFDSAGRWLLQRRSSKKRLWPGFWSNSCCSHPRTGEETPHAARARLQEELGFSVPVEYVFKYEYRASFRDEGSEYELCSVFRGTYDGEPDVDADEVQEWRYVDPGELRRWVTESPEQFSPWFRIAWQRVAGRAD